MRWLPYVADGVMQHRAVVKLSSWSYVPLNWVYWEDPKYCGWFLAASPYNIFAKINPTIILVIDDFTPCICEYLDRY